MKNTIVLPLAEPISAFSTNDAHLFSICGISNLNRGILCCNALNVGFSITKTKKEKIYECYLKIDEKDSIVHNEVKKKIFGSAYNLEEYIFESLSKNTFLILDVDVSQSSIYKKVSASAKLHCPLISGIDTLNHKVLVNDFFNFKQYSNAWISTEELYNSYAVIEKYLLNFPQESEDLWIRLTSEITERNCVFDQYIVDKLYSNICSYLVPEVEIVEEGEISSFYLVLSRINSTSYDYEQPELLMKGSGLQIYDFILMHLKSPKSVEDYRLVKTISLLETHFKILNEIIIFLEKYANLQVRNNHLIEQLMFHSRELKYLIQKNFIRKTVDINLIEKKILSIKKIEIELLTNLKEELEYEKNNSR